MDAQKHSLAKVMEAGVQTYDEQREIQQKAARNQVQRVATLYVRNLKYPERDLSDPVHFDHPLMRPDRS